MRLARSVKVNQDGSAAGRILEFMNWSTLKQSFSPSQRFNRDALWNLGSFAVLGVSGLVLNYIIARRWNEDALGVFNQVYAIYIVLSQLAVGGVHASVLRQVSYQQENLAEASFATSSGLVLGTLLAGCVCLLLLAVAAPIGWILGSDGVAVGLLDVAPALFFFSLNKILLNVLNGARHMRAFAVFSALRFVLILVGVGIIAWRDFHFFHLAASFSIAETVLFFLLAGYVRKNLFVIRMAPDWRDRLRGHFAFGVRGVLASLVSDLNTRVDVILLGWFFKDEAPVGLYSMAAILAEGFYQFPVVIQRNVNPLIGKAFAENDTARIEWMARKTRRVMHVSMFAIAIVAGIAYGPVMRFILPTKGFDAGTMAFVILMVGIAIQAGFAPMGGILFQGGRPGAQSMLMVYVVTANIALNLVLIPLFGINGSAASTAVAYVLQGVLTIVFAKRYLGIKLWP